MGCHHFPRECDVFCERDDQYILEDGKISFTDSGDKRRHSFNAALHASSLVCVVKMSVATVI